ncbi:MAG: energy transducer TonB [Gammaproteobacteria bacterium]|nr:energy transducer TonB [Gammaproteobacteria bacterium]
MTQQRHPHHTHLSNGLIPSSVANTGDRLGITLFFAAVLHGIFILGVSFSNEIKKNPEIKFLDVILVNKQISKTPPEEAEYLAQVSQEGGGNTDDRARPTSPFTSTEETDRNGIAPAPLQASSPKVTKKLEKDRVITQKQSEYQAPKTSKKKVIEKEKPVISAELIERSMEIARLSEELDASLERYAKRPRKKFISARTRESVAAAYMHQWVQKVERIGNLNYPDAARRQKLSGSLVLAVAVKPDGSLHELIIRRSSGHQVLDDAARRIVKLASPFAPMPDALRKQTDILYITRTWEFRNDSQLYTH